MTTECAELKARLESSANEASTLSNDLESKNAEISNLTTECDNLKDRLESSENEVLGLSKDIEEKTLEIAMLNTLSAEKDKEVERLEISMQESSLLVEDKIREVSCTANELDEIKNNSSMVQTQLEGKVKEMEENLSVKESEIRRLSEDLEGANLAIETSKETINALSAELNDLKAGKESLEEEMVQKTTAISAIEEDLTRSSSEKDNQIQSMKEELSNLEKEKQEMLDSQKEFKKKVSKNFKEKLSEMNEKEKNLMAELEEQRSTVDALKESLATKDSELVDLNESLAESNQTSEDLNLRLSAFEKNLESEKAEISTLTTESAELKAHLESKKAEISNLTTECDNLNARLNVSLLEDFPSDNATLSAQVLSMASLIEEKDIILESLNEDLRVSQKTIEDLSSKLDNSSIKIPEVPYFELKENEKEVSKQPLTEVEEICVPVMENIEVMAENEDFFDHLDEGIDDTDSNQVLHQPECTDDDRNLLIQELQTKITELEGECIAIGESSVDQLTSLNNDVNTLSEKVNEQEEYLEKFQKENKKLQQDLSVKDAIVVQLESQLEVLSNSQSLQDAIKSNELISNLQKDLSFRKRVIASMNADAKTLKMELDDSELKNKELFKAYKELETKMAILSEKLQLKSEKSVEREEELLLEIRNLKNEMTLLKENSKSNELFDLETSKRDQKMVVLQERLKMKGKDLKEVQQFYNSAVKSWEDEKEMLEANCAACHQEFVDLKTEHVNSQSQLLDKEASLNSQIGDLSCELSLLKKEKDDLEGVSISQQIGLQNEISNLENQLQLIKEKETELQKELEESLQQNHKEKDEKENISIQLNALKETLSKSTHQNADFQNVQMELQRALGDLALRKKLVASMEKEMKGLKEQLALKDEELASKMKIVEEEKERVESNDSISKVDEVKLRKEIEHLTATLIRAETKASNAIMEARIKEDTMKLREDNYKQQTFCLQSEIQDQRSQLEHLQRELQNVQFALLCSEKEKETLLRENRENLEAVDGELRATHQRLAEEAGKVEELRSQESEKEKVASKKKNEVLKRLEEVLPGEQDMSELKELVGALAQQIASQEIDIKGRKKMVSINDQLLNQSKEEMSQLKSQVSLLENELSGSNEKLQFTQGELDKALETLENMQPLFVVEETAPVVEDVIQSVDSVNAASQPITEEFIDQVYETETHVASGYHLTSYQEPQQGFNGNETSTVEDDDDCIQDEFQKYIDMVEELQLKQVESEEKQNRLARDKALLQEQLQHLVKQKEEMEQQIIESEQKIKEYEQLVMKFAGETDEAKGVVGSITYQRDLLHNDLFQLQQNFSWREKELSNQLIVKQNEINGLHENLNGMQQNINSLHADKEQQFKHKDEVIDGLSQQNESFEKEILERQQDIHDLKQMLQTKEDTICKLQNDVVRLTQMTMDQNKTNEEVTKQLQLTASNLARTKDELSQHRAMYAQNIQALQQCFEEVSQNTAQIEKQLENAQARHKG